MSMFEMSHAEIRGLMDYQEPPTDPEQRRAFLGLLTKRGRAAYADFDKKSLLAGFWPREYEDACRANTLLVTKELNKNQKYA